MQMEQFTSFEAILFPADGRPTHCVQLMTSPDHHVSYGSAPSRVPHPEVYMDYIAENLGSRAWKYEIVDSLEGMNRKFAHPYIVYYPVVSRDGMPFPINKTIRDIQGNAFRSETAWRGNLVVGKYSQDPFSSMMDASMSDFPLLKNWFLRHPYSPQTRLSPQSGAPQGRS